VSAALVDGRRESWLESRSVVALHRLDLPVPRGQVNIFDEARAHVARVDFLWTEHGVVGEADGWAKYQLVADPTAQWEALKAEKVREDRLRDLGYEVIRWTAAEALRPETGLGPRLARALARSRPQQLRGTCQAAPDPVPHAVPALGLKALTALSPTGRLLVPTGSYSLKPGELAS
jgi:hypothetical protein